MSVFLIWRRPTPCAPSNTRVRLWNAGSPTGNERNKTEKTSGRVRHGPSFTNGSAAAVNRAEQGSALLLTRHFDHLLVRYQIQLIEDRIVFRQIFIPTLFLFTTKYWAINYFESTGETYRRDEKMGGWEKKSTRVWLDILSSQHLHSCFD